MTGVDRAVALAAALHGEEALGKLVPAWRARVRAALAEIGGRVDEERRRSTAPVVRGREQIHPSWLTPSWMAACTDPRTARWIERFHEGDLADMPAARGAGALPRLVDLPLVDGAVVQRALEDIGLARLAIALQAAPEGAPLRIAAHLGPRAYELLDALARPAERAEIAVAVRELTGLAEAPPLFAAGARHAGPALALLDAAAVRRAAQRLPRPLGLVLVEESRRAAPVAARANVVVAAVRAVLGSDRGR